MDYEYKILQLMPAVGWCVFYSEDEDKEFGEAVACFALIEETHPNEKEPYQLVVPLVPNAGCLSRADVEPNFKEIRYAPDFKPGS